MTHHRSNHAVLVSSSRYWFNYRHAANVLSIYQILQQNGVPEENIVLMVADDFASNARNPSRNGVYTAGALNGPSLYQADTQIDYRGDDVTLQNLVQVLTGRHSLSSSASFSTFSRQSSIRHQHRRPVLHTDENSQVLVYLTGHGGDQFFKFQDVEEIMSTQIAAAIREMSQRHRFRELLLVADTCQAMTLADHIQDIPQVLAIASSLRKESSYGHHADHHLGVTVIERYTHALVEFIKRKGVRLSLQRSMVDPAIYPYEQQKAHIGAMDQNSQRKLHQIPLSDFFAQSQHGLPAPHQVGSSGKEAPPFILLQPMTIYSSSSSSSSSSSFLSGDENGSSSSTDIDPSNTFSPSQLGKKTVNMAQLFHLSQFSSTGSTPSRRVLPSSRDSRLWPHRVEEENSLYISTSNQWLSPPDPPVPGRGWSYEQQQQQPHDDDQVGASLEAPSCWDHFIPTAIQPSLNTKIEGGWTGGATPLHGGSWEMRQLEPDEAPFWGLTILVIISVFLLATALETQWGPLSKKAPHERKEGLDR